MKTGVGLVFFLRSRTFLWFVTHVQDLSFDSHTINNLLTHAEDWADFLQFDLFPFVAEHRKSSESEQRVEGVDDVSGPELTMNG